MTTKSESEIERLMRRHPDTTYRVVRTSTGGVVVEPEGGSNLEELGWRGVPSEVVGRYKNGRRI